MQPDNSLAIVTQLWGTWLYHWTAPMGGIQTVPSDFPDGGGIQTVPLTNLVYVDGSDSPRVALEREETA